MLNCGHNVVCTTEKYDGGSQRLNNTSIPLSLQNREGLMHRHYMVLLSAEPVLLDLKEAAGVKNLSLKDKIYLALAFEEVRQQEPEAFMTAKIAPCFREKQNPYVRVKLRMILMQYLRKQPLQQSWPPNYTPHKGGFVLNIYG